MARHLDPKRMRSLNRAVRGPGPVVYWMSRDQRAADNWALLFAQEMALDAKVPLGVVFALDPSYPPATRRSLGFLLRGLAESARDLGEKGIPFFLLEGPPGQTVPNFASRIGAGAVFCDFDPLRAKTAWKNRVAESLACPLLEVDAHNIVPAGPPRRKRSTGPTRCGRNWRGSSRISWRNSRPWKNTPSPGKGTSRRSI